MRTKTLGLIAFLSLSIMLAIPSAFVLNARAVEQSFNTTRWSAYGPRTQSILFTLYTSSASALGDFDAGLLDLFESPDLADRVDCASFPLTCDQNNVDYWVTKPVNDFGIFELDINHQVPWLGKTMQVARTATGASVTPSFAPAAPSVTGIAAGAAVCAAGQFSLRLTLKNNEDGGAVIVDANEVVTATPPAGTSGSASDGADGAVDGVYNLPCLSNTPPSYVLGTNVYGTDAGGPAAVTFTSASCASTLRCTADFNVNYRSPSTKKPTWDSIHIVRALAHLVDKPNFRNLNVLKGKADCLDVWAPAAQNLMNTVGAGACTSVTHASSADAATNAAECAELISVDPTIPCAPISLYNLASDVIGGAGSCGAGTQFVSCVVTMGVQSGGVVPNVGYSGTLDIRAACDQLLLAGFSLIGSGGCAGVAADPQTAHVNNGGLQLGFFVRSPGAFPPRTRYGQIIVDGLNWVFGTPAPVGGTVCFGSLGSCSTSTLRYYSIGEVTNIVFAGTTDWTEYTGGYTLGSTPDHLFSLHHSRFASNLCGGIRSNFPNNYPIYCDPVFDAQARAAQFSASLGQAYTLFQKAATLGATRGENVPQYSQVNRFVGLNSWNWEQTSTPTASSLVNQLGHGFQSGSAFYPMMNMRAVPGYTSTGDPVKYAAGGGNPNLIRRPSSNGPILHLNPFTAQTVWEFDPIVMIWDSLLATNPNTGGSSLQLIDWLTKSHTINFDSTTGKTTQVWNLRPDICWQDSTVGPVGQPCDKPVISQDVCFSILTVRDVPSANAQPSAADVLTCSAPDNQTVVVVLSGQSPFFETNVGGLFIIPSHIWGAACGWPAGPYDSANEPLAQVRGADCGKESFDSMALGMMIGSSAYECRIPTGFPNAGKIGGSCTTSSTGALIGQNVGVGGHLLLTRNDRFARCCDPDQGSNLQALSWADFNKDGKVTLVDAANLAAKFNSNDAYFDHPLYSAVAPGVVDVGEAAYVSNYFDVGTISPWNGLVLVDNDPVLDPYLADLGGGNKVYYLGISFTGGAGTFCAGGAACLLLARTSGAPLASDFTASADGGAPVTGANAVAPLDTNKIVLTFPGLAAGSHTIVIKYQGNTILTATT